jgi:hypothetical protein
MILARRVSEDVPRHDLSRRGAWDLIEVPPRHVLPFSPALRQEADTRQLHCVVDGVSNENDEQFAILRVGVGSWTPGGASAPILC